MCVKDAVLGLAAIRDTAPSSETSRIVLPEGEDLQLFLDFEPHSLSHGDCTFEHNSKEEENKVKVRCTLVQALRLCTGTARRRSRGTTLS
jgi:hypothetical protein